MIGAFPGGDRILRLRRIFRTGLIAFAAVSAIALVACTGGGDGDEDGVALEPGDATSTAGGSESTGDSVSPDGDGAEPTPSPVPATSTPLPTATPEPVNTNENVRNYAAAHGIMSRGDYSQAERRFSIVIEIEPDFARGYEGRATALMAQGKTVEAIADYDRAIELKPDLGSAYAGRAVAELALGDILGANRDAVQARRLDPENPNPVIVLGRIMMGAGRGADALEMFNEGVALAPDEGPAYWWRARFLYDIGNIDLALTDLGIAIQLSPISPQPYLDRAAIYMDALAEFELARADIEEARSLAEEPRDRTVLDNVADLLAQLEELEAAALAG